VAAYYESINMNNPALYNCDGALDAPIDTFRSNTFQIMDSLQVRLEKRYSHGLQYEAAYTFAHALDNASSASLGSVKQRRLSGSAFIRTRIMATPTSMFVKRFVFSYVYDLPFGRGRNILPRCVWRSQSNYRGLASDRRLFHGPRAITTPPRIQFPVANADCGGTVGYYCSRPNLVGIPMASLASRARSLTRVRFAHNTAQGTFGNAGRNIY